MKSESVPERHIGVDVSKAKLDIYVPAAKEGASARAMEVGNQIEGFRVIRDLARKLSATVCMKPTGGYEGAMGFPWKGSVANSGAAEGRAEGLPRIAGSDGVGVLHTIKQV